MSRIQAAIEGGKDCDISLWVGFINNRATEPVSFVCRIYNSERNTE